MKSGVWHWGEIGLHYQLGWLVVNLLRDTPTELQLLSTVSSGIRWKPCNNDVLVQCSHFGLSRILLCYKNADSPEILIRLIVIQLMSECVTSHLEDGAPQWQSPKPARSVVCVPWLSHQQITSLSHSPRVFPPALNLLPYFRFAKVTIIEINVILNIATLSSTR